MLDESLFWLNSNNKVSINCFSRTGFIRYWQKLNGHSPCFGVSGKTIRKDSNESIITPSNCGENICPFRIPCEGLHENAPFSNAKLREKSIEVLSKVFFIAKIIKGQDAITEFQDKIEKLIKDWNRDTPQVATLGAFSSGKSTFINRILNTDILPIKRTPTTGVVTIVCYGHKPSATLDFKKEVTIGLHASHKHTEDRDAVLTLHIWVSDPEKFGIKNIFELLGTDFKLVDIVHLKSQLEEQFSYVKPHNIGSSEKNIPPTEKFKRTITRHTLSTEKFVRNFKVEFADCEPINFDLGKKDDVNEFKAYLSDYQKSIRVEKAVCRLPHNYLKTFNLLDTAGLCSPHSFHTSITEELLSRRPDKLIILLDSRNLYGPTNCEAIKVLKQFVSSLSELRRVTFCLTFWDLSLHDYMENDREPELSFLNENNRKIAAREFSKEKRRQLREILESSLDFRCEMEPVSYTLALGCSVPDDIGRGLNFICKKLYDECSGWVGVKMWAERWKSQKNIGNCLLEETKNKALKINKDIKKFSSDRSFDDEITKLSKYEETINKRFSRIEQEILEQLNSKQSLAILEINMLDSKSQILEYTNRGYTEKATNILDSIKKFSKSQFDDLLDIIKGENILYDKNNYVIDFDRRLLGLDESAKKEAEGNITGLGYYSKAVWDFLLGSIKEWNASSRAAARDTLKRELIKTTDITRTAINRRNQNLFLLKSQLISRIQEQKQQIEENLKDKRNLLKRLNKRLSEVEGLYKRCERVEDEIKNYTNYIISANERIVLTKRSDFNAYLVDVQAKIYPFKKGPSEGTLVLFNPPEYEWKEIVLEISEYKTVFYPQKTNSPVWVKFKEENKVIPYTPSCKIHQLILHLTTMTAKLRLVKTWTSGKL